MGRVSAIDQIGLVEVEVDLFWIFLLQHYLSMPNINSTLPNVELTLRLGGRELGGLRLHIEGKKMTETLLLVLVVFLLKSLVAVVLLSLVAVVLLSLVVLLLMVVVMLSLVVVMLLLSPVLFLFMLLLLAML